MRRVLVWTLGMLLTMTASRAWAQVVDPWAPTAPANPAPKTPAPTAPAAPTTSPTGAPTAPPTAPPTTAPDAPTNPAPTAPPTGAPIAPPAGPTTEPTTAPTSEPTIPAVPPLPSDETIASTDLPVDLTPTPPRYPRRFIDRPLILPEGISQLSIGSNGGHETSEDTGIFYARGGLGLAFGRDGHEVAMGIEVLAFISNEQGQSLRAPRFQRLYADVSWPLLDRAYVGVQGVIGYVFSDYQRYSPSVYAGYRFRVSENTTITAGGGVDYNYGHIVDDGRHATHRVGAFGSATARTQVGDFIVAEASGSVSHIRILDDGYGMRDAGSGFGGSVGLVFSATPALDVGLSFGKSWGEDTDRLWGGIGIAARTLRPVR